MNVYMEEQMLDGGKVGKCEEFSGFWLEYQVMAGQRSASGGLGWGGPRPQILGGGRKKMGKWIVQLCVAAVPTRRGRAGSQLQPCVGVGWALKIRWGKMVERASEHGSRRGETAAFSSSSSSSVMWMSWGGGFLFSGRWNSWRFDRRTLSATLTSKPALGLMMLHLLSGANSPKVCLRSRC